MNTSHIRFRKRHDEGQNIHNTRSFLCMTMYHARYFHFRIPSPFQVVILKAYLVTHSYPKLIQSSSFQRAVFFRIPSPPCSPYVIHYLLHFVASPPTLVSSPLLANLVRFRWVEPPGSHVKNGSLPPHSPQSKTIQSAVRRRVPRS